MTGSIGQPEWMTASDTRAVIAALEARGGAGCARFVGGSVRNTVMGRPVDDIDIATSLGPDEVSEALRAAGLKAIPTGIAHGTVTAIAHHKPFEITTLRRDVSTDGRNATVAFTDDWREDALRRDFRFNALYADARGQLFDPTGGGVEDARAGRVVFVGDPETRLHEDYLRILRFFRFFAWYGRGEPDAAALAACAAQRHRLDILSAERVQKELLKLLAARDPRPALHLMADSGVLAEILPAATGLSRVDALVAVDLAEDFEADAELRLAALLPDDAEVSRDAAGALRLSNAARDRLVGALTTEPAITAAMDERQARRLLWRIGAGAFRDQVRLAWAASPSSGEGWRGLLEIAASWQRPQMPVRGQDAIDLGAPRGPAISQAMGAFEAEWIGDDFPLDREEALARLKAIVAGLAA